MKKSKYIIGIIIAIICIVGLPLFIDWAIIGNNIPSNISNSDWVGFLGAYTGSIIGGIVSLAGLVVTISFTRQQVETEKIRYEEQKRLNNLPSLDCQIEAVNYRFSDDCIDLNLDKYFQEIVVGLAITNVGVGVASNICYGIVSKAYGNDGRYWIWKNRVVLSQKQVIQRIKFGIPNDIRESIELRIFYDDVLENTYEKKVIFFPHGDSIAILTQDKGQLTSTKEYQYYVIPAGKRKKGSPEL